MPQAELRRDGDGPATGPAPGARMRHGGVALQVAAADATASDCARERLGRIVTSHLAEGERVCVSVTGAGHGAGARQRLAGLLDVLAAACARAHAPGRCIDLSLPGRALPPAEAWRLRRAMLGRGLLYLRTDRACFVAGRTVTGCPLPGGFWAAAWRLSAAGFVHCSHAASVASASPLLPAEEAGAILPGPGLAVPAGSAWVVGRLDVAAFADAAGGIDWPALTRALGSRVDEGDRAHDEARWPAASMRHDGWRNRRLAILVTGLGEIASRQGGLPVTRERFAALETAVTRIRGVLVARSRQLAQTQGMLPALAAADPTGRTGVQAAGAWAERWNTALASAGVRHRNLLAMSPFSLLPVSPRIDPGWFDLLPLLEQADACAALPPFPTLPWKYKDFMELQRRTWAALERGTARRLVAEQV